MLTLGKEDIVDPDDEKDMEKNSLTDRFMSLSANARIIVIAIPLLIIAGIALLVLIIIKLFKSKNNEDYEDLLDDEIFDGISFGNFTETEEQTEISQDSDEESTVKAEQVEDSDTN